MVMESATDCLSSLLSAFDRSCLRFETRPMASESSPSWPARTRRSRSSLTLGAGVDGADTAAAAVEAGTTTAEAAEAGCTVISVDPSCSTSTRSPRCTALMVVRSFSLRRGWGITTRTVAGCPDSEEVRADPVDLAVREVREVSEVPEWVVPA